MNLGTVSRQRPHRTNRTPRPLSFTEAEHFLTQTLPATTQAMFRGPAGLERANHFFTLLGSPHERLKAIHIAGTSGKSSTAYILTRLLLAHGFTVGTELSPHTYDIRERMMINGRLISKAAFVRLLNNAAPALRHMQSSPHGQPIFFEAMTGLALQLFDERTVDYAVIETGVGGLLDPTNAIQRQDKLAVICRLGFDHMAVLGNTIESIAAQKAGIIPAKGTCLYIEPAQLSAKQAITAYAARQQAIARPVIHRDIATEAEAVTGGSRFTYTGSKLTARNLRLNLLGSHQVENAVMALQALEVLAERDNFTVSEAKIRQTLNTIRIPGRSEVIRLGSHLLVADGAHNSQKMEALIKSVRDHFGNGPFTWITAAKKGKDAVNTYRGIAPYVKDMFVTQYTSPALQQFVTPAERLAGMLQSDGLKTHVAADVSSALRAALAVTDPQKPIIATGSIYLLGELRAAVTQARLSMPI